MAMPRYAIRITYPDGKRAYVIDSDDRRKRYRKRKDAETDKRMLDEFAGSHSVCQRDYIPPQYKVVRLA